MQGVLLHKKKNVEPCAPPVFVRGNCRSQGFGNSYYYWAGPYYCWMMKTLKRINTWLCGRMNTGKRRERKREFGFINLPAAFFWKSWHPNICINAACMFLFFVNVDVIVFLFFLKPTAQNGRQLYRSFTAAPVHLMGSCEWACVCVCIFVIEMCLCVNVCFLMRSHTSVAAFFLTSHF